MPKSMAIGTIYRSGLKLMLGASAAGNLLKLGSTLCGLWRPTMPNLCGAPNHISAQALAHAHSHFAKRIQGASHRLPPPPILGINLRVLVPREEIDPIRYLRSNLPMFKASFTVPPGILGPPLA